MKEYGAKTKKPTMLLTNLAAMCRHHRTAQKVKRARVSKRGDKRSKATGSLCRKYIDRTGKPRFAGTVRLKKSQSLGFEREPQPITTVCSMNNYEINQPQFEASVAIKGFLTLMGEWVVVFMLPQPRVYPARFATAIVKAIPATRWARPDFDMDASCLQI